MTLRKGAKGEAVAELQRKLQALRFLPDGPRVADGDFGSKTHQAVVDFQTAYLVDGIVDDVTEKALTAAHKAWTQKDEHLLITRPNGVAEVEREFGTIEFEEAGGGGIVIVNNWERDNIVRANLPIVGEHLVHKKMEPVFRGVLQNIKDKGLDKEIRQFGVWCPRHKMHDPKRNLSTHSWAIACDVNWATNPVGKVGDIDPAIVDSFERFGFEWGGRWRYRDDMHFQFCTGF